jgi:hypothetical protein
MERFIAAKSAGLSSGQLRRLEREGHVKPVVHTLGGMRHGAWRPASATDSASRRSFCGKTFSQSPYARLDEWRQPGFCVFGQMFYAETFAASSLSQLTHEADRGD